MEDSIYLKGLTVSDAQNKIPYYHKRNNTWCVSQVSHTPQYTLRRSKGFLSLAKEPTKKTHKPNNSGGVSIDEWNKLIRLSRQYGNSYAHPRSGEIFHFVSESRRGKYTLRLRLKDKKHYNGLPREPYHRYTNQPRSIKLKDGKEFNDKSLWIGRPTKQWRGIWNMSKRSAQPKYNVWGNPRYNWGDSGLIKLKQITERCEFLSRQIRG